MKELKILNVQFVAVVLTNDAIQILVHIMGVQPNSSKLTLSLNLVAYFRTGLLHSNLKKTYILSFKVHETGTNNIIVLLLMLPLEGSHAFLMQRIHDLDHRADSFQNQMLLSEYCLSFPLELLIYLK